MPAFLSKDYYCHTCKKGYTRRDKHKCPNKCLACFKAEKHVGDNIVCKYCNRVFLGENVTKSIYGTGLKVGNATSFVNTLGNA